MATKISQLPVGQSVHADGGSIQLNAGGDIIVNNSITAGGDVAVAGIFSVGAGALILADGSAIFANSVSDPMTIDPDGTVRIAGAGISAKYTFFRDGTGFMTTENIETAGDLRGNQLNINSGAVLLNASGDVACTTVSVSGGLAQIDVAGGVHSTGYNCNGMPGITHDYAIIADGVLQTFHFEGGILTSVV